MIPLVLDQGLPRRAAEALRLLGWDVVHVGELGMQCADDPVILELARSRGATVVTLDGDFGEALASTQARTPSVVHVRIEPFNAAVAVAVLPIVVAECLDALRAGCVVSVTETGNRWRVLPIGKAVEKVAE